MPRNAVRITRVGLDDDAAVECFAALWAESRVAGGHSSEWAQRTVGDGALQAVLARKDVQVYLATGATGNDGPAGFLVALEGPLSTLAEHPTTMIEQLYVAPHHRLSGVSKALLARVAKDAQSAGARQLVSCVPTQVKDVNRYFARLGFAPSVTQRTISPSGLLRHLAGDDKDSAAMAVVRRRRSLRARARARIGVAHSGG